MNKTYIGDGVYASDTGDEVLLETERMNGRHHIYLSGREIENLFRLMESARGCKIKIEWPKAEGRAK